MHGRSDVRPNVAKTPYMGYASARLGEFRQLRPRIVGSMDRARAFLSPTVQVLRDLSVRERSSVPGFMSHEKGCSVYLGKRRNF